jgi:hypothetical protein
MMFFWFKAGAGILLSEAGGEYKKKQNRIRVFWKNYNKGSPIQNAKNLVIWALFLSNFLHTFWLLNSNICSKCPNFIPNVLNFKKI